MINRSRFIALLIVLAFMSVLAVAAVQEKSEEMVKDPVCGTAFKKAEAKGEACCPMAGLMHGKDIEFKVENTKDGVQVNISAKDAEIVKKLQDMAAKMKAGCEPKACAKEEPGK